MSSPSQHPHGHQFQSAIKQLQQWLNNLMCLGSDVRFIATTTTNSSETTIVLCNNILKVIDEVVLSSRTSSFTNSNLRNNPSSSGENDQIDRKVEEQAKISVIERTFSLISKWIQKQQNKENMSNGLHIQLHCAFSLMLRSKTSSSNGNIDFSKLRSTLESCFTETRRKLLSKSTNNKVTLKSLLSNRNDSSDVQHYHHHQLRLLLAKLCFHYHDGELLSEFSTSSSSAIKNSKFSPSQAFLLSIPNHASYLAVEALAQHIENSYSGEVVEENLEYQIVKFIQKYLSSSSLSSLPLPKTISIPYPSNPSAEPNVLNGLLVSYLFTPEQILSPSSSKKSKNTTKWETSQDTTSDSWRNNRNFESECGIVVFSSEFSSLSVTFNEDVFISLISEIQLNNDADSVDAVAEWFFQNMKRRLQNDHCKTTTSSSSFIFVISSSTCDLLSLDFIALVSKRIEKKINLSELKVSSVVFSRVSSLKQFENLAFSLNLIPEVVEVYCSDDDQENDFEFYHCCPSSSELKFHRSGLLPDYLSVSNSSKNAFGDHHGILMELQIRQNKNKSSRSVLNTKTTVILHRRTISQLSALQSMLQRIWSHLVSCLQCFQGEEEEDNTFSSLVRGGGATDCMWIKTLTRSIKNDETEERRILESVIRSYLSALVKSNQEKLQIEERINNFVASTSSEEEFVGNLFFVDEDDAAENGFPIDVLHVRENNLRNAINFADFVSSIASVERGWNFEFVHHRKVQYEDEVSSLEVVVNRTLEFQ